MIRAAVGVDMGCANGGRCALPLIRLRLVSGRLPDQPIRVPASRQRWEHLTFLHWRYDAETVQALIPPSLRVQGWDGSTWVGITPFRMVDVRLPVLPPPPAWRDFPELNVRAYVRAPDGRDGIWFLGMAVPRVSFLAPMRAAGLPYERSRSEVSIVDSRWSYRFDPPRRMRRLGADPFAAVVDVGDELSEHRRTPLVDSITGRWSGFHRRGGILLRTPIAHEPWPLLSATADGDLTPPLRWSGLPEPAEPALVHAAPVVHTSLGPPRPVRRVRSDGW
ncbi:hypothetical protein ES5_14013 [Dietzia cinnamea P4]|nr:hypothetical protein ES5_14013 [Dietzia cinnamea P4]